MSAKLSKWYDTNTPCQLTCQGGGDTNTCLPNCQDGGCEGPCPNGFDRSCPLIRQDRGRIKKKKEKKRDCSSSPTDTTLVGSLVGVEGVIEKGTACPHGKCHGHGQRLQVSGHDLVLHDVAPNGRHQSLAPVPLLRLRLLLLLAAGGSGSRGGGGGGRLGLALLLLLLRLALRLRARGGRVGAAGLVLAGSADDGQVLVDATVLGLVFVEVSALAKRLAADPTLKWLLPW